MNKNEKAHQHMLALWWVDLNRHVWPDDLSKPNPAGGLSERDEEMLGRGAWTVVNALADESLRMQLWREMQKELLRERSSASR